MFVLSHAWIVVLNSVVVPNLAAAVTDSKAPGWVKGLLAGVFTAILAVLEPVVISGHDLEITNSVWLTFALSAAGSQAMWDQIFKHKVAPVVSNLVPLNLGKPASPKRKSRKKAA